MNDEDRGKIRNKNYVARIRDFSGLRYGKITPTDIDAFMDFGNKVFIFIETKFQGSTMSYGQKLALERLCDACSKGGIQSLVLIAEYTQSEEEIDFAPLPVVLIRLNGQWRKPHKALTLRQAIDDFLAWAKL